MVIRVAMTTKKATPDLYDILKLLGTDRIKTRIDKIKKICYNQYRIKDVGNYARKNYRYW